MNKSPVNRGNELSYQSPDPSIKPPKNVKEAENFEKLPMEFHPVQKS